MGLFVGTARLNACHSLGDQLGGAESPIGQTTFLPSPSHRHKYTDTHLRGFAGSSTEFLFATLP